MRPIHAVAVVCVLIAQASIDTRRAEARSYPPSDDHLTPVRQRVVALRQVLKTCYRELRQRQPATSAVRTTLEFRIGPRGMSQCKVVRTTHADGRFGPCLCREVERAKGATISSEVQVRVPFVFVPDESRGCRSDHYFAPGSGCTACPKEPREQQASTADVACDCGPGRYRAAAAGPCETQFPCDANTYLEPKSGRCRPCPAGVHGALECRCPPTTRRTRRSGGCLPRGACPTGFRLVDGACQVICSPGLTRTNANTCIRGS